MAKKSDDADKHARAVVLAEQIKVLFMFCYEMVPDIDLLEEVLEQSYQKGNFAMSAAPLLGAVGMDYEEEVFDASLHAKRAKAVLELVKTLRDTEVERMKFADGQKSKAAARAQLRGILG